jgi:proline iminopeptidase
MKFLFRLLITSSVLFAFCNDRAEEEKSIPITKDGYLTIKEGKIWYRIYGDGPGTPVLVLHGGPGSISYYLFAYKALAKDRPVIFFDQLGSGKSDHLTDTTLMTKEYMIEELEEIRAALGYKEYILLGHSWGTALALESYLANPKGIKAIAFTSPYFSTASWIKDAQLWIRELPDSVQQLISLHEKNKTYSDPGYQRAIQYYYSLHMTRKPNDPADTDSLKLFPPGDNLYMYMWGPSEFTCTGKLKNYDRESSLSGIKIPTLLITGEFDEARPERISHYTKQIPGSRFVMIPGAGHATLHDNPDATLKAVQEFISGLPR